MERTSFSDSPPVLRANVQARVKWYNPTKRFGFVELDDGTADAFLHVSVVEQLGYQQLPQGTLVACDIAEGPRGPQVSAIVSILEMPEEGAQGDQAATGDPVNGTVKFFNAAKGFGFVVPEEGGADIFVSGRILTRCGLAGLDPNQRVLLRVRQGDKGPMAEFIEILPD